MGKKLGNLSPHDALYQADASARRSRASDEASCIFFVTGQLTCARPMQPRRSLDVSGEVAGRVMASSIDVSQAELL